MMADSFYDSSIPFAFAENKLFREFLLFVAPNFRPPSEEKVGNELLTSSYNKLKAQVDDVLVKEKSVVLGIDGSSDGCSDPITHIVNITPTRVFLHEEIIYTEKAHTSENILSDLNKAKEELNTLGVVVVGMLLENILSSDILFISLFLRLYK